MTCSKVQNIPTKNQIPSYLYCGAQLRKGEGVTWETIDWIILANAVSNQAQKMDTPRGRTTCACRYGNTRLTLQHSINDVIHSASHLSARAEEEAQTRVPFFCLESSHFISVPTLRRFMSLQPLQQEGRVLSSQLITGMQILCFCVTQSHGVRLWRSHRSRNEQQNERETHGERDW